MVEHVERFQPDLEGVAFAVGHGKPLGQRHINRLEMRRDQGIPPKVAEGSGGRRGEGSRVVPARWRAVYRIAVAGARIVGAICSLVAGAGVVGAADTKGLGNAAL